MGLGDLPGSYFSSQAWGISGDGSTVVGRSVSASGHEAFLWTAGGGMRGLGDLPGGEFFSEARAASEDGSVIVGNAKTAVDGTPQDEFFRWTEATGMVGLSAGTFDNGDVSADGSVVVSTFRSDLPAFFEAFRWTDATGAVGLGTLPGDPQSFAEGISGDGSVVVGRTNHEAFRWVQGNGMVGLGDLRTPAPSYAISEATGISPDGFFVVGVARNNAGEDEPFRWDPVSGMRGLGTCAPDRCYSAWDVSADGAIVVGSSNAGAFIWDEINGIRILHEVLTNGFGLDLTGWTLESARGISDDGRKIVGTGINPNGDYEGWIAILPGVDCLCEVQNINPNQVVLQNVGTGGKGADRTRNMVVIVHAVDAPGATCDPGEFSEPTSVNLKMVDDTGNILIDSSKTIVCEGGGATTNLKRNVFFQGPLNCENGAVPGGSSTGSITSTGTGSAGTSVYVESTKIKCFE